MKTISILLLFAIVAITLEKAIAEYLLVEIEDEEGRGTLYLFCYSSIEKRIISYKMIVFINRFTKIYEIFSLQMKLSSMVTKAML